MTPPSEPQLYVRDRFVPASQAVVPVYDRGFLYGDGVFDTVRAYAGKVFASDAHYQRWSASAAAVGIEVPLDKPAWQALLADVLRHNDAQELMIRVCLTRGSGSPVPDPTGAVDPLLVIIPRPSPVRSLSRWQQGVRVMVSSIQATPAAVLPSAVKSHNFLSHVLALGEARSQAAHEALLCNSAGEIVEGSISNLFGVWDGDLITPPLTAGVLPGITRATVLELARTAGIPIREVAIPAASLAAAEELWLTNTGWEVMPITQLDGAPVADGMPGAVTCRLQQAFVERAYTHTNIGEWCDIPYNTAPAGLSGPLSDP